MEYTIAAIPTTYKGRQYRSRLEARWASMFDALGWWNEYEPFDMGSWSPDFLVKNGGGMYLVEVKPLTEFDADVAEKMVTAVTRKRPPGQDCPGLFLTGVAPVMDNQLGAVQLAWCNPFHEGDYLGWRPNYLCWMARSDWPRMSAVTASAANVVKPECHPYAGFAMGLWAEASNRAQWKPEA